MRVRQTAVVTALTPGAVPAGKTQKCLVSDSGKLSLYLGGFTLTAAAVFEVVDTALFVIVILGSTGEKASPGFAGHRHHPGGDSHRRHPGTGVSVNPARSFGPAVLVGGTALTQLWLFIVAPLVGAVLGALPFRLKLLEP